MGALHSGLSLGEYLDKREGQPIARDGTINMHNSKIKEHIAECIRLLYEAPGPDSPRIVTIDELTKVMDLSSRQVYRLVKGYQLPTTKASEQLAVFLRKTLDDLKKRTEKLAKTAGGFLTGAVAA